MDFRSFSRLFMFLFIVLSFCCLCWYALVGIRPKFNLHKQKSKRCIRRESRRNERCASRKDTNKKKTQLTTNTLSLFLSNGILDWVVHYSALLSAVAEKNPTLALSVNINGFQNMLELAKVHRLRLYSPSTIGAFGPSTPKDNTPDLTIMRPNTIYGITKLHNELMGEYYREKFGVDFRSARYPGILSADTAPGGGTTDYAVDIFHHAIRHGHYDCFLSKDTRLPMMYLSDCIKGTVEHLTYPTPLPQTVYNLAAVSFTPEELANEIKKHLPNFTISYPDPARPDFRQAIADSWPGSLDDSKARKDFGWKEEYGLENMVKLMLDKIQAQVNAEKKAVHSDDPSTAAMAA